MSPAGPVLLSVHVAGTPKPQGSKRGFVVPGKDGGKARAVVVDTDKGRGPQRDWRYAVTTAAIREMDGRTPLVGPLAVRLVFAMPRPAKPKSWAPWGRVGDVDKLARSVLDSLTDAAVWTDDAQVCDLAVSKRYPGPAVALTVPGVLITVTAITPEGLPA